MKQHYKKLGKDCHAISNQILVFLDLEPFSCVHAASKSMMIPITYKSVATQGFAWET